MSVAALILAAALLGAAPSPSPAPTKEIICIYELQIEGTITQPKTEFALPKKLTPADRAVIKGDDCFDRRELECAKDAYLEAIQAGEPRVMPYARYKLGWIERNIAEPEKAAAEFRLVAESGGLLGEEAEKDYIWMLGEIASAADARAALDSLDASIRSRRGQTDLRRNLIRLASAYEDLGHLQHAIDTLEDLLRTFPGDPSSAELRSQIEKIDRELKRP